MTRLALKSQRYASEDELHEQVARALAILLPPPVEFTTMPSGGYLLTPAAASRLYRLGLKTGWPDVIISYQGIYGIELKNDGGQLSKTRIVRTRSGGARVVVGQRDMHTRLLASGMRIAVCRSLRAVLDQLGEWQIPTREAKT